MSLRLRLALFIAVAIALALLVQGFLGYASFERLQLGNLERELDNYLRRVAAQTEMRRGIEDHLEHVDAGGRHPYLLGRPLRRLINPAPPGGIAHARLVQEGRVTREWGQFPEAVPLSDSPRARLEQNWLYKSLYLESGVYIQGALEASQVQNSLAGYRQTLVFTALVVSLLGALAAWMLSGPALRPLRHLLKATRRIADSGDLSLRVPPEGSGELLHLSQTFNQMLERLAAFRQREVEFTRHAAHELRTPLTAIRLQLDAYRQGLSTPEETLSVVQEEVERMTCLSESLLTLAREGRGQKVGLDLAQLALRAAGRWGLPYQGPGSLEISGDPILIEQALENLIQNTKKHAPGAPAGVDLESRAPYVVLRVWDEGPGMPKEAMERAFEPFYRAPGVRAPGHGLGLSVVARVAEAHGGKLVLLPNQPQGLRAELWLREPWPE
ncbi:MAG: HAMP domain-containing histidine kinase [Meiothermus sp.]|uniref:sensor histidine kinase n=1 Tax=Meiothermus sp. TaxID=1955249 RepID=UPI0025FF70FA|nr:HAMP domain-containing sensor histidine kinase [Meiothermus sp.]MCS7057361.1 HAMP domain-containing histidine kinase [Meiothermus sp.]MCS7193353.1 HAMP domain-containing histidine kinase [Meiothermus sp.]MCX7741327.1 HAMP domain-containing histidine kinase [Meiothermus sp.]MDW8091760.1 HAMP domain-containing sensor histidine kinase [Meiothermus sp.]MDW8480564.1 HAMP domain-containing sensor histidine kinase [Meiothermus sp.]